MFTLCIFIHVHWTQKESFNSFGRSGDEQYAV